MCWQKVIGAVGMVVVVQVAGVAIFHWLKERQRRMTSDEKRKIGELMRRPVEVTSSPPFGVVISREIRATLERCNHCGASRQPWQRPDERRCPHDQDPAGGCDGILTVEGA